MKLSFKLYSAVYFLACFVSLFYIDTEDDFLEMILKISSLTFLAFLYISVSKKINYWYILILMCSIASDAFFIFDPDFLREGVYLVLVNRFLYFIILKDTVLGLKFKYLRNYIIPGFFLFVIISYLLSPYLKDMMNVVFVICFFNISLIVVAYFHFLKRDDRQNRFFFLAVFLIGIADFLLAFNKYLEYNLIMVIIYTVMYYIARYLICLSIIEEKQY
ncbi:lysoplasmalogenase family protein [Tenacibaculum bernardetii]|uniref:lysoplasmalogenase family protein n=1 Tax=Tenacibaculum bernardetii TaxID=3021375 RepID=UPI0023B11D36|nr:lysoplasmalogenase family protein [Tenacibaculum bernardetii]